MLTPENILDSVETFKKPGTCPECGHYPDTGAVPTHTITTDYRYESRHYDCESCGSEWHEKWQVVLVTVTNWPTEDEE